MVSIDIYVNETTRHADVILPPPAPLEKSHYDLAFPGVAIRNVVNYSPAIIETSAPPEWEIYAWLALIAGGADPAASPALVTDMLADGIVAQRKDDPDIDDGIRGSSRSRRTRATGRADAAHRPSPPEVERGRVEPARDRLRADGAPLA